MCRHVGYLGPRRPLADVALTPVHGLVEQSYRPRELLRGSVCADGFGLGWYADGHAEPAVYRRDTPIWADPDLPGVARVVTSDAIVGMVRNATPAVGHVGAADVQPFAAGTHLFTHNGFVADFADRARELRAGLPDDLYSAHRGGGDSETLFLLCRAAVREEGDLVAGVRRALADVARRAPGSALNVLVADGRTMVASRFTDGGPADSLYVNDEHPDLSGGVVVASEALDDAPGWRTVPEGHVVSAVRGSTQATLEEVL